MSDITLAVGDGNRRMTYAELAEARGISLLAARRLTLRHHWPKQSGNDGLVRVSVPLSALTKPGKSAPVRGPTSDTTSSESGAVSDTARAIRALESAVDGLREQLMIVNQRLDHERERADQAAQQIETLHTELAEARI